MIIVKSKKKKFNVFYQYCLYSDTKVKNNVFIDILNIIIKIHYI
jgi:hypothetical protein